MLPEFSCKIIFPWGQDRTVTRRRRHVACGKGDVHLRCGRCGGTDFTAHVRPGQLGVAKITNLACSVCGKVFPFNAHGETGGSLKFETADARQRENINRRPDSHG